MEIETRSNETSSHNNASSKVEIG